MQFHEIVLACQNLTQHLNRENELLQTNRFQEVTRMTNDKESHSRAFEKVKVFMMGHPEWVVGLPKDTFESLREELERVKVVAEENERHLTKIFTVSQKLLKSVTTSLQSRNQLTDTYTALGKLKRNSVQAAPPIPAMAYDQGY